MALLVGLVLPGTACVPVPFPSTVSVEESADFEAAAEVHAPEAEKVLGCVGDRLAERRADVRIVGAEGLWDLSPWPGDQRPVSAKD